MAVRRTQTYDFICFTDLAYEFNPSEKNTTEKKIKRRLKYYNLGPFNQDRIEILRQLKNELYAEISSPATSKYYQPSATEYADLKDFDVERMTLNYRERYDITKPELKAMISFAIYLFYLR